MTSQKHLRDVNDDSRQILVLMNMGLAQEALGRRQVAVLILSVCVIEMHMHMRHAAE